MLLLAEGNDANENENGELVLQIISLIYCCRCCIVMYVIAVYILNGLLLLHKDFRKSHVIPSFRMYALRFTYISCSLLLIKKL